MEILKTLVDGDESRLWTLAASRNFSRRDVKVKGENKKKKKEKERPIFFLRY